MRKSFCFILSLLSLQALALTYTLADLRVLYSEKSYNEYMKHHLDVRPSKRDFEWKKMTREMATAQADEFIKKEQVTRENFNLLTKYIENKNLKAYAFYTLAYSKFARLYFKKCNNCIKDLDRYISHSARYPDIDFDIYKNLNNSIKSNYDNLVKAPLKSNDSIYYCKEEQGQKALVKILVDEIGREDTKDTIVKKSKDIFNPDCLNGFSKEDIHALLDKADYTSEIIYLTFRAFEKIDDITSDTYLMTYLLTSPKPGPIMNMAWNQIEMLSANYKKRMKIFDNLKKQYPLSGEIFERKNGKVAEKSKIIIKRFAENFPEYLNFYGETCLNFYSGKVKFARGNPALHCDDFMAEEVAGKWMSDTVRLKYSGAKKIN